MILSFSRKTREKAPRTCLSASTTISSTVSALLRAIR